MYDEVALKDDPAPTNAVGLELGTDPVPVPKPAEPNPRVEDPGFAGLFVSGPFGTGWTDPGLPDSGVAEGGLGISKDGLFVDSGFGTSAPGVVEPGARLGLTGVPAVVGLTATVTPASVVDPGGDASNCAEELGTSEATETPTGGFGALET